VRRATIASLLVAAASSLIIAAPAQAQPSPLAAIGDSYMAGIGAGDYVDTTGCRRSERSYAADASRRTGNGLVDASCPGARIPQVLEQSTTIPVDATGVLVQVGGNDIGFGEIAAACLLPWSSNCLSRVAEAETRLPQVLDGLSDIATAVRQRAPQAQLIMAGYPRLLASPRQCSTTLVGSLLEPREITAINALQVRLDATIRDAARDAGARFVDWPRSVDQHSLCSSRPWFVTVGSGDIGDALHPTREAYAAMGRDIARVLRR
jgi:lysophospholipase L1-like esterase